MLLNKDRMAVLSGLEEATHQGEPDIINESIGDTNEELDRLRQIIREEVQAVFSEMRASKDIKSIDNAIKEKNVGAAMGFNGPGFGSNPKDVNWGTKSSGTEPTKDTAHRAPVHGLLGRGFGF